MPPNQPPLIEIGPGLSLMIGLPTLATWKKTTRPAKPKRGTFGFNTDTSSLEYYDGADWYGAAMGQA